MSFYVVLSVRGVTYWGKENVLIWYNLLAFTLRNIDVHQSWSHNYHKNASQRCKIWIMYMHVVPYEVTTLFYLIQKTTYVIT